MKKTLIFFLIGFCLLSARLETIANDSTVEWNRFRGPNGSGVAPKHWQPPVKINDSNLAWRTETPKGLSSPVIGGDYLFLTGVENDNLVTLALSRKTGTLAWKQKAPGAATEKVHRIASPAASTPLALGDRVIVYFGSFGLLCYSFQGEELWRKPIPTPQSLYGMSTSPIFCDGKVILVLDSDRSLPNSKLSESKLLAVDPTNGKSIWETPRPFYKSGWSTPVVWQHDSENQLIVLGQGKLHSYNAATGVGNWFVKGFSRETIAVPLIGKDYIFGSSAQLGGGGDDTKDPAPFWQAILPFDSNKDGKIERSEMTGEFTFPFRPELPPGHPGFGMPLPEDPKKRSQRIDSIVTWVDRDNDKAWTKEEFFQNMKVGRGKPRLVAIKPGGNGDVSSTHVSWEINRGIPEIPSPIIYQNLLYLVRKGGIISAHNSNSGASFYRERIPTAPGQYAASPIIAGEHLYAISSLGKLSIIELGEQFTLKHQFDLGEAAESTPAVDEMSIYIRTEKHILTFRRKGAINQP